MMAAECSEDHWRRFCKKTQKISQFFCAVLEHAAVHNASYTFSCSFCGSGFNDEVNYVKHTLVHKENNKPFR